MTPDTMKAVREYIQAQPCTCQRGGCPRCVALDRLDTEASQQECICGNPSTLGIVHRKDGPCYHAPEHDGATGYEVPVKQNRENACLDCVSGLQRTISALTKERDRLREALEKISAAEVWSHGHHIRLDETTIQEVTVFAAAALADRGKP